MTEHEMFSDRAERQLRGESSRTDVLMAEARALSAEREKRQLQVLKQQEEALRLAATRLRDLRGAEAARMRTSVDERLRRWKADIRAISRKLDERKRLSVEERRAAMNGVRAELHRLHHRVTAVDVGGRETDELHRGIDRLDARVALAEADVQRLVRTHHDVEWASTKMRVDREWSSIEREKSAVESSLMLAIEKPRPRASQGTASLLEEWWAPLLRGALAVVLSTVVLLRPGASWTSVAGLFFAIATIDGLFQLAATLLSGATSHDARWWTGIANGVLGIVAGALVAFGVPMGPFALVTLLSWWSISHGALTMLGALDDDQRLAGDRTEWLEGLSWVALGSLAALLPSMGPHRFAMMFGAFLYASGGLLFALGLRLRGTTTAGSSAIARTA